MEQFGGGYAFHLGMRTQNIKISVCGGQGSLWSTYTTQSSNQLSPVLSLSFVLSSSSAASSPNLPLQLAFKGVRFYPFKQSSNFNKIPQIKRLQGFRCTEDTFKHDVICIDHSKVPRGRVDSPSPSKCQLSSKCSKPPRYNWKIFCNCQKCDRTDLTT